MKVIILCGGLGTRLKEQTEYIPKPMVMVGDNPILWHIMKLYDHFGFKEFILTLGYKGDAIKRYFFEYNIMRSQNTTVTLGDGARKHDGPPCPEDWKVHLVDTGVETMTARRIKLVEGAVRDDEMFLVTYGDGVADIDVHAVIEFHKRRGLLATIAGYTPISRWGVIEEESGVVKRFVEKPKTKDLINMGFMVFSKGALAYFADNTMLERGPLVELARDGQLAIYRHDGFFFAMDTQREYEELNRLWREDPKWKVWKG